MGRHRVGASPVWQPIDNAEIEQPAIQWASNMTSGGGFTALIAPSFAVGKPLTLPTEFPLGAPRMLMGRGAV